MNDLDLVRELRATAPKPTPAQLQQGRTRLMRDISTQRRPARRRYQLLPVGGVAACAVAAGVVALAVSHSGPAPTKGSVAGPVPVASQPQAVLAAQVLTNASVTVAQRPTAKPGPHQWIRYVTVDYSYGQTKTTTDVEWTRFDGQQDAYLESGKLVVHNGPSRAGQPPASSALSAYDANATLQTAYEALASLPTDPKALLAAVDKQLAKYGPQEPLGGIFSPLAKTQTEREFAYLARLLWNATAIAPPAAESAVFRAMATMPGISVQTDATDVVNRPAVSVSADGGTSQLLLDPHTYQVTGARFYAPKDQPTRVGDAARKGKPVAPGTLTESMARTETTLVGGPGQS